MTLYYFHLRDGIDILLDPEGRQLEDAKAIAGAALAEARSIIGEDARQGRILLDQHIDVEDEAHNVVHSLDFADAVEIVHSRTGTAQHVRLQQVQELRADAARK